MQGSPSLNVPASSTRSPSWHLVEAPSEKGSPSAGGRKLPPRSSASRLTSMKVQRCVAGGLVPGTPLQAFRSGRQGSGFFGSKFRWRRFKGPGLLSLLCSAVLGSFLKTLTLFCEDEYEIFHELEEFYEYDFKKIWKCSQAEGERPQWAAKRGRNCHFSRKAQKRQPDGSTYSQCWKLSRGSLHFVCFEWSLRELDPSPSLVRVWSSQSPSAQVLQLHTLQQWHPGHSWGGRSPAPPLSPLRLCGCHVSTPFCHATQDRGAQAS